MQSSVPKKRNFFVLQHRMSQNGSRQASAETGACLVYVAGIARIFLLSTIRMARSRHQPSSC